jgi:hypothetical protein
VGPAIRLLKIVGDLMHELFLRSHPFEWIFLSVAFVGFLLAVYSYLDAQKYWNFYEAQDRESVRHNLQFGTVERMTTEGMRTTAQQQLTMDMFNAVVHSFMLVAAISFIFTSPPPPGYSSLPQSLIGLSAWILVSFIMAFSTFTNLRYRRRLEKLAADREVAGNKYRRATDQRPTRDDDC